MDFYTIFKRESFPSLVSSSIAVGVMSPLEVLRIQSQCTVGSAQAPSSLRCARCASNEETLLQLNLLHLT